MLDLTLDHLLWPAMPHPRWQDMTSPWTSVRPI
jgi:hypothetical protein